MNTERMKCAALTAAALAGAAAFAATTHYVVPAGTAGNSPASPYTSWATAANSLADAVSECAANDTVLVKPGTYSVTATATITKSGVKIRSCDPETDAIDREGTVFDGTSMTSGSDMIYAGEWLAPTIEGFTFQNAKGRAINLYGARNSKVLNCTFTGNTGLPGAAIRAYICAGSVISNCIFTSNSCSSGNGGALYSEENGYGSANWTHVIDCTFTGNTSSGYGGAIMTGKGIHLKRCRFSDNTAATQGGHAQIGRESLVEGCVFTGSAGASYGQVLFLSGSDAVVSNCTFTGLNYSTGSYGAVMPRYGGTIADCVFTNNTKITDSFIMVLSSGNDTRVRNCLFADNGTFSNIFRGHDSTGVTYFDNCTIAAEGRTIAGTSSNFSTNIWRNCILLGTTPATKNQHCNKLENCCTTDPGFVSVNTGTYRLRSTSPCIDAGGALDWHSGAVDLAGNARVVGTAVDIGCYERQPGDSDYPFVVRAVAADADKTGDWTGAYVGIQAAVDAAADESLILVKSGRYELVSPVVVSNRTLTLMSCNPSTGATDRDGTILDGQGTTRILMSHCGEFSNTLDADYHDIPIAYRPVRIEGFTFTNGVTTTSDGLPFAGNGGGLLMYGRAQKSGQEPSKVVDCLFADCSAVNGGGAALVGGILERCVFTGNQASSKGGGAAFVQPTTAQGRRANYDFSCTWYSPAAVGCTFTNNTAAAEGGGLALNTNGIDQNVWVSGCGFFCNTAVTGSSACNIAHGSTISNCVFRGNSGANYGVVNCGSHEWFTDCTFENNSARYGTAFVGNSGVRFTRCKFIGNTGAGVWGYATLVNCLIADSSGGACLQAFYDDKEIVCEGCTLVSKNTYAPVNLNRISFRVSLTDCIVWQRGSSFPFDSVAAASSITATNCCFSASPGASVADSFTLVDTFARDPRFKDADGGDYSIRHSSPCRDKAVFLPWMNAVACDLAGNPRVVTDGKPLAELPSARPDIGCYENQDTIKGTMLTFR